MTGACWLRCALVDLRLEHVRNSWGVYLSTVNMGLEPDLLTIFGPLGFLPIFRYR